MKKSILTGVSAFALILCLANTAANAQEDYYPAGESVYSDTTEDTSGLGSYLPDLPENGHIAVGLGMYEPGSDDSATDIRVEYRPDVKILADNLKPWAGAEVTTDASIWLGGGLLYDLNIQPQLYLVPSVGVGGYLKGGSDLDLGHFVEFRTQLEIAYELQNQDRVSIAASHMSNMDIGDTNPGTETIGAYYSMKFGN